MCVRCGVRQLGSGSTRDDGVCEAWSGCVVVLCEG